MQDARRRIRLSAFALAFFLGALALLHLLNWNSLPRHVSGFVRASGAWLWSAGLLALSAGLVTLGACLPAVLPPNRDARLACRLLFASGLVAILLVLFPTDATPLPSTFAGYVHDVAAASSLLLLGCAMFILVDAGQRDGGWRAVAGGSFLWPGVTFAVGNGWGLGDLTAWWPLAAIMQRILAVVMVGWFIAVALRASSPAAASVPAGEPTSA